MSATSSAHDLPAFQPQLERLFAQVQSFQQAGGANAFLSPTEAAGLLKQPTLEARYRHILLRLLPRLEREHVLSQLSTFFGLATDTVEVLVTYLKDASGNSTALQVLTEASFANSAATEIPTRANFPEQFAVLSRLQKSALVIQRLPLRPEEIAWLTSGQLAVLDPAQLPIAESAGNLFEPWQRLLQLIRLRDALPDGSNVINRLLIKLRDPHASVSDAHTILAQALELPVTEVTAAVAANLLNLNWPADYKFPGRLLELVEFLYVLKRMGISVQEATSLTRSAPDEPTALAARRLLQAHFDADTLSQRLKPVADSLRERQRDALVAYLVARDHLRDAEALYDYMLIDVKMGACMRTSRIKQALSAIQLFVQCCLMNLERISPESEVQPSSINASRWQWMENYRVWEANRKVFLYPENWIEPELRDDKSEIFHLLESDLQQSELNHEQAVEAFRKYLDRLMDISHLTMVSMYEERQFDEEGKLKESIVHLVARDGEKPYRYFYRQWHTAKNGAMRWTPWEEITLQLSSDHVLVFVRRGHVYLAWPTISKSRKEDLKEYWQVSLNLGRRTTAGWTSHQDQPWNIISWSGAGQG